MNRSRPIIHFLSTLSTKSNTAKSSTAKSEERSIYPIVDWDGPHDPHDPFNWSATRKSFVVGLGLLASFAAAMNGTIISVAHEAINTDFGISDASFPNSYWPITSWGIGGALFPLFLFPAMEEFGIRPVFLLTYLVFICTLIPIGLATNFATLIVARFFSGGCVQLLSNAVASTISNVFADDRARSIPISLYVATYLVSTSIGPVIGASIFQSLSWRWIAHIELIWTTALFPLFAIALPETRAPAILRSKAKHLRQEGNEVYTAEELSNPSLFQIIVKSVRRPLYMLVTEPVVFVATLWAAFSLGTIYLFTQSVEQVYRELYGWNAIQAGYIQLAIAIGEFLGWLLCLLTNSWYEASTSRNTEVPGTPIPEARLYPSILGGFIGVTGGMFTYGWTSYPHIHWIAPTVGLVMVGAGTTMVIVSIANYLIDAYSKYAASALSAVGLVENTALAVIPLAATSMYNNLGFHWASSLLAFVSLILVATPFAVIFWGKDIRNRSKFMKEAMLDRQRNASIANVDAADL